MSDDHPPYCWHDPAHHECYTAWVSKMQAAGWTSFNTADSVPAFFAALFRNEPDGWSYSRTNGKDIVMSHEDAETHWAIGQTPPPF